MEFRFLQYVVYQTVIPEIVETIIPEIIFGILDEITVEFEKWLTFLAYFVISMLIGSPKNG